jgi:hypothetical protein
MCRWSANEFPVQHGHFPRLSELTGGYVDTPWSPQSVHQGAPWTFTGHCRVQRRGHLTWPLNVVKTITNHPIFDGLYHLWWFWGWLIIVLTTFYTWKTLLPTISQALFHHFQLHLFNLERPRICEAKKLLDSISKASGESRSPIFCWSWEGSFMVSPQLWPEKHRKTKHFMVYRIGVRHLLRTCWVELATCAVCTSLAEPDVTRWKWFSIYSMFIFPKSTCQASAYQDQTLRNTQTIKNQKLKQLWPFIFPFQTHK